MKKHEPVTLGTAIDGLIRSLGLEKKIKPYTLLDVWDSIVGEQISKVTRVEKIVNGVVTIKVSAAPWRAELTLRKKEILGKIHEAMRSEIIHDIKFR